MRKFYTPIFDSVNANIKENKQNIDKLLLKVFCALLLVIGVSRNVEGQTFSIVGTGTGANTTSSYPAPFGQFYYGARHQFYITAAQLTAAGIPASATISSVGFNVTADNGATLHTGFSIKVYQTATANPISAGYLTTGLAASSASSNYNPVAGWNQVALSASFVWNGTSNLVIETCFNNTTFSTNASTQWTSSGLGTGTWSRYRRADGAGVCANTNTTATSTSTRPNMRFGWVSSSACSGTPAAGTATITSATGCPNTNFTLNSSGLSSGSGITYQWQTSASAGGTYANVGALGSSLVTSTATTAFYRLRTTCSNSGSTNVTNVVSYTVAGGVCACASYPANYASDAADEEITNVTVGSMNNNSNCATAATGAGSVLNRYGNYAGVVTGPTAQQSSSVNFSLTQTSCGGAYNNYFQIYVDWNQDGDWYDVDEQVYSQGASVNGNHTATGSFTVPALATVGTTRMRVVNVESAAGTYNYAHNGYTYGETEDYCFTVTAAVACSGTPAVGTATITSATGCPNTNFTLNSSGLSSGTGISYLWESSPNNSTWSSTGFTTATYTTSTATTMYYRLKTTCSGSASSSYTNVVSYTVAGGVCACASYPANYASYAADEEITNVTVGSMNNNSNCATAATGAGSVLNRYGNYAGVVTGPTAQQSSSVNFSLTQTSCGGAYNNYFQIYVDWNQDGDWYDVDEQVYSQGASVNGNHTATGSFTVPALATVGTTRMRVVNVEAAAGTDNYAHNVFSWGETEDYCFTVTAAVACSGTPAPGASIASPALVGTGGTSILTLTTAVGSGASYNWQSSATAGGTYVNVVGGTGATTASYTTATLTTATWFRCQVTCASSTGTSTPVEITVTPNALSFDGSNDRVNCGSAASVDITGTTITLEAWIYPTAWRTSSWEGSIINKEIGSNGGYMLRCGASGTLSFNLGNGGGWYEVLSTTNALTLNTWQHVAGTYDGTTLRLFRDGTQISSIAYNINIASAGSLQLTIGNWSQDDSRCFAGLIDEVRIWSVTKSAAELLSGMTQTPNPSCANGLRASYSFNQGLATGSNPTETTLFDATTNANNGTLSNMALSGTTSNWVAGRAGINPIAVSSTPAISTVSCAGPTSITGTGVNGSTIIVYSNAILAGTTTVASGVWSYATGSLVAGASITATQTSAGGCASALTVAVIVADVPSCIASGFSPADGNSSVNPAGVAISWAAVANATGYDVYFNSVLVSTNQPGTTYTTSALAATTLYTWKVVPKNACGAAISCATYSFTTSGSACTPPTISSTPQTNILCFGLSTGQIIVTATGGSSPFTFSADNGATWQGSNTFSGLAFGPYSIVVKGFDDCLSAPTVVTLTQPAALSATASGGGAGCNGTTLALSSSVSGGTVPYSYSWSNASGLNSGTSATPTATIGSYISHTLTVTDAAFCQTTAFAVSITNNTPAVPTSVTATTSPICTGQSSLLNATSAGNYINWYSALTGGALLTSLPSATDYSVTPAGNTTYYAESVLTIVGAPQTTTFNYTGAITTWTVPAGVSSINVTTRGAQGGSNGGTGGLGALTQGTFSVTPGQVLSILVGQQPANNYSFTAGGGGTYVANGASYATATPLIVAGGGGGGVAAATGQAGQVVNVTTTGDGGGPVPGSNGNGAASTSCGGGGGGFYTSGGNDNLTAPNFIGTGGAGFRQGGAGGSGGTFYSTGGFGGGASPNYYGSCNMQAGAGGGYSGGSGQNSGSTLYAGFGGGSYNSGTSQTNTASANSGNGQVVITYTPVTFGCTSTPRQAVTVTVNQTPTITYAATPYSICVNSLLASQVPTTTGTISTLTISPALPSGLNFNTTTGAISGTPTVVSPATTYTISAPGTCAGSTTVSITTKTIPSSVDAGADVALCAGSSALLSGSAIGTSSTTIFTETFESYGDVSPLPANASTWRFSEITASTWVWQINGSCGAPQGTRSLNMKDGSNVQCDYSWDDNGEKIAWYGTPINASLYINLKLNFKWMGYGESGYDWGKVVYSLDGVNWTEFPATYNLQSNWQTVLNLDISSLNGATFYIGFKWRNDTNSGTIPGFGIDDISITGDLPISYSWSPATYLSATNVANPTASNVTAGLSYTMTATSNGCSSSDNVTVSINTATPASVVTASGISLATGDLLWSGNSSTVWGSNTNWYAYDGTNFVIPGIGLAPTALDRVFVLPSSTSGICVSATNNTIVTAAGAAKDVFIGTGATMVINPSQILQVNGNWTNNGTFTQDATATVEFTGGDPQTLGGLSVNDFTNLTLNKSADLLTLNTPATVSGTLTMTSGNIATTTANLLTVGTAAETQGSIAWTGGTVLGPIKRYFSGTASLTQPSGIFPVGYLNLGSGLVSNRNAQVNYTLNLGTGGSITAEYKSGETPVDDIVIPNPPGADIIYQNYAGLPAFVNGHMIQNYENEGYWEITPGTPLGAEIGDLNTAQYSLKLRGNNLTTVSSLPAMSQLRMIKSTTHTSWDNIGIGEYSYPADIDLTGGVSDFTITNRLMTGFSWFNIGSGQISWLPVELTNFAANCNEKSQVDLKWSTASEQNSANFIIERSRDLTQWEYVSTTNAAGNSNYNIDYSALETDPLAGVSYYRLVQLDINGTEKIYGPISVSCAGNYNSIVVFPNPTQGNFTVEISSTEMFTNAQLQITDLTGKIIHQRSTNILEGKNQFTFEGLDLQLGTYIINLNSVNGKINPVRIVVQ